MTVGYLRYMSSLAPSGAGWSWLALAEGRKEDMGNCFPMPCAPYTSLYGGLTHSRAAIKHHDAGSKLDLRSVPLVPHVRMYPVARSWVVCGAWGQLHDLFIVSDSMLKTAMEITGNFSSHSACSDIPCPPTVYMRMRASPDDMTLIFSRSGIRHTGLTRSALGRRPLMHVGC